MNKAGNKNNISKESVGLAGEYAVAAELCRRGFYAQLTLGNHKKTDLIVERPITKFGRNLFRVSVKAKTGPTWPRVTGIWEEGDLLVFVDFKGKPDEARPDFYVLTVPDWKETVKELKRTKEDGAKIDKTNTLFWEPWNDNEKGWYGCSVSVANIKNHKDAWPAC